MTYKDKTFCASKVSNHTCDRVFTEYDKQQAEKIGLPVAWAKFCEENQ